MESKLLRIRELINQKEEIESELHSLINGSTEPKAKRKRRTRAEMEAEKQQQLPIAAE